MLFKLVLLVKHMHLVNDYPIIYKANIDSGVIQFIISDQIVMLGLFHSIAPANSYSCTTHVQYNCQS